MPKIELSADQEEVFGKIIEWLSSGKGAQYMTLGGLAGTGKTTLIGKLIEELAPHKIRVALMAYTGRAALVLSNKCRDAGVQPAGCGTIHRFLYKHTRETAGEKDIRWVRYSREELQDSCDLIVVDEASMVPKNIFSDLTSIGLPVLFVGDHGQLPPIDGNGFNLMEGPDWRLEKIHRQAEDSPIIKLAHHVREGNSLAPMNGNQNLAVVDKRSAKGIALVNTFMSGRAADKDMILLCGMNRTRIHLNRRVRSSLKFSTEIPDANEKVICLKNDLELGIMNGYLGTVVASVNTPSPKVYSMTVDFDDAQIDINRCRVETLNEVNPGKVLKTLGFGNLKGVGVFDYGYAVSVHKAQGSEWDVVLLYAERNQYQTDEDYARWLYTGITRAKRKLAVLI